MTSHTVRFAIATVIAVCALASTSVFAQPPDTKAALVNDVGNLSNKFTGLARVMSGKYDWRPGQGVRSVGDVLNLIVSENNMLAGVLSGSGGGMGMGGPGVTDPAALQEALRASYDKVQKALSAFRRPISAPASSFSAARPRSRAPS